MDIEGQKLRDTFLWNKNESMLAPEQFAEVRTHFQGDRGGGRVSRLKFEKKQIIF